MPAASAFTPALAWAAVYCALMTSFCERKLLTRSCSWLRVCSSLLLLLAELLVLRLHRVDLLLGGGLAGQRLPGQVFPALPERGLGLVRQVGDRVLQLLFLQLDPLARSGDVDQPLADPVIWSSICW